MSETLFHAVQIAAICGLTFAAALLVQKTADRFFTITDEQDQ